MILPALSRAPELRELLSPVARASSTAAIVTVVRDLSLAWLPAIISCDVRQVRTASYAALSVLAPPLIAFALFFCVMHAPRHILRTVAYARPKPALQTLAYALVPLLIVAGAVAAAWRALIEIFSDARLMRLLVVGLAALTVTHMALVKRVRLAGWEPMRQHAPQTFAGEPRETDHMPKIKAPPKSMAEVGSTIRPVADGVYRIAAVASLSGIPAATIRMWEPRYQVVRPARRASNGRLYSRADIERLAPVKQAVDAGHAISTIAAVSNERLQERLSYQPARAPTAPDVYCRVLVCGAALAASLAAAWQSRSDILMTGAFPSMDSAADPQRQPVDALIVDAPLLKSMLIPPLRQLRALTRARIVIVVYAYTTRSVLAPLDESEVIAITAPPDPVNLARICLLGLSIDSSTRRSMTRQLLQAASPRRYDDMFLSELSRLSTTMQCECPNHLAELLTRLNAFERYSLDCESSNLTDAATHALLYSSTAHKSDSTNPS